MSAVTCPSCGTAHGPAQRYCLGCGALVGQRSVAIDQVLTGGPILGGSTAPAEAPPSAVDEDGGVWRRPATSIATALALVAGVTAGFLTSPQGGVAGNGTPVALGSPAGTQTAPTPAEDAPAADPPAEDAAADPAPAEDLPVADEEPLPDATSPEPADAASPTAGDATEPLPAADPDPAPAATTDKAKTKASSKAKTKTKTGASKSTTKTTAKGPKIDHVWVIGINVPLARLDGDYAGDRLLSRATELPRYTPASTDPLLGGAALVAGGEPSADGETIVGQLTAAKRSWRAYGPGTPNCTDTPAGIPLLSFPTVTSADDCADHVAGLEALATDLNGEDVPAFSYVATDPTLDPAGLEAQLEQVVEPIRRSAAFKQAGLITIVPTAADPVAATGALVLSPFAEGSTSIAKAFGPYSLLRTVSELLAVDPLGQAAGKDVKALGPDVLASKD